MCWNKRDRGILRKCHGKTRQRPPDGLDWSSFSREHPWCCGQGKPRLRASPRASGEERRNAIDNLDDLRGALASTALKRPTASASEQSGRPVRAGGPWHPEDLASPGSSYRLNVRDGWSSPHEAGGARTVRGAKWENGSDQTREEPGAAAMGVGRARRDPASEVRVTHEPCSRRREDRARCSGSI